MRDFVFGQITGQASCTQSGTGAPGKRQVMDRVTGKLSAISRPAGMVWEAMIAAICAVIIVTLGAAQPAHALDARDTSGYRTMPGGQCYTRVDQDSTGASIFFRRGSSIVIAGGSFFSHFDGAITLRPQITAAWLEANCGFTNVTGLVQDGADGTVASDDQMFVRFTADVPGIGRYDFDHGLYGVTGTVVKRDVVLTDPAPTVTLSGLASSFTGPQTITATFSEAVTGFDASDIQASNGTVSGFSGSGSSYSFTLTPAGTGAVSVSVPANVAIDSISLGNAASNTLSSTAGIVPIADAGDDTAVTSGTQVTLDGTGSSDSDGTIASYQWTRTGGTGQAANAVLSDATAAQPTFTDSSLAWNAASVTHVFELVVTDDDGLASVADSVTITINAPVDTTAPSVNISAAPVLVQPGTTFDVDIAFSEPVTGLQMADISVTNASVSGLSGSGDTYVATLVAAGSGEVTVTVPAGVAQDVASNDNTASNTLRIADATVRETQKLIAGFMQARANLLLRHQPGLTRFLSGTGAGTFGAHVTRNQGNFDFASNPEYPFWAELTGAWSKQDTSRSKYFFGAMGAHQQITPNLLFGAMVEIDHVTQDDGQAELEGTGWMIGPYFVAKSAEHPLYFEGRLLYGESRNRIAPFGTYKDDFDTQRLLAQFKVVGEVVQGRTTWSPFFDASYTTDDQDAYTDSLGNTIPSQGIELGQIEAGLDFSMMMPARQGEFELWGGISGIWSSTGGSGFARSVTPAYEGGRASVKLGVNHALPGNQRLSISSFYDGIGTNNYESYGLSVGYESTF